MMTIKLLSGAGRKNACYVYPTTFEKIRPAQKLFLLLSISLLLSVKYLHKELLYCNTAKGLCQNIIHNVLPL